MGTECDNNIALKENRAIFENTSKNFSVAERFEMLKHDYDKLNKEYTDLQQEYDSFMEEFQFRSDRLDRIVETPFWKYTKWIRAILKVIHQIFSNIRSKIAVNSSEHIDTLPKEHKEYKTYGRQSFPNDEKRMHEETYEFHYMPKISVLVPIYNTPMGFLRDMIGSLLYQTYQNWELCIADGSDNEHSDVSSYCEEMAIKDNRIKYRKLDENKGISDNTNKCFEMANGEYIGLFDHDDVLHPSILFEYVKIINEQKADFIYCDELTFQGDDVDDVITIHLKPDFSIDNLRANNYICHFSSFSRDLVEGNILQDSRYDGSQDHDMILRLTSKANKIVHLPKVLYYWRSHKASVSAGINAKPYAVEAAKSAVARHLKNSGFNNFKISSTRAFATIFRIEYEIIGNPLVSIIIANKDHKKDLKRCIDSILEKTRYNNYEIIIVENNSESYEILEYYEQLHYSEGNGKNNIRIVRYEGEFNYSAINNLGVQYANGEYIVLLNNDIEVMSKTWIEELLMYAQRDDVGCVGAKLLYPDMKIQHAGVIVGMGTHRVAGHCHHRRNYDDVGYMGRLSYAQNISAVTGACLMISKEKFVTVNGLDEQFRVSLNDVDLCLKIREKGYLNIFTPFAVLIHYESLSRGDDVSGENAKRYLGEVRLFQDKWKDILKKGDPYFNPNFSLDSGDFCIKEYVSE